MSFGLLSPRSSSLSSVVNGDYLGNESCVDDLNEINNNGDQICITSMNDDRRRRGDRHEVDEQWRSSMKKKEFPPPIPLLAHTENLSSRMPWVLNRNCTSDGRLILTVERVKHHEYFIARRSNGRLTLQLVPLDEELNGSDDQKCCCGAGVDEDEDAYNVGSGEYHHDEQKEDFDVVKLDDREEVYNKEKQTDGRDFVTEDGREVGLISENVSPRTGNCLNHNNVIVTASVPCFFSMPVPASRPVPI